MNILFINCSPNKNGNTAALAAALCTHRLQASISRVLRPETVSSSRVTDLATSLPK